MERPLLSFSGEALKTPVSTRFDSLKGKEVWRENVQLAALVNSRVSSCFGPNGAYKMVTYNRGPEQVVKISKDPIPVLEELGIQYPVIKVACEAAKMQREEAGDGVTEFILILTALLKRAEELMSLGVHPNTILDGYKEAAKRSIQLLHDYSTKGSKEDCLIGIDCGRGLLTPRIRGMLLEAYETASIGGIYERDRVKTEKSTGGKVDESQLVKGVVVKRDKVHQGMPNKVEFPKIALLSGKLGVNRMEVKMKNEGPPEFQINITNPSQIKGYKELEHNIKSAALDCLAASGVTVLLCEQIIDDDIKFELTKKGVFALEKVDRKDSEAVARATGARIIADVKAISSNDLGQADLLEVDRIEPEKVTVISGCEGATFILKGSTFQAIEEFEALLRGGITTLSVAEKDGRFVAGGGAIEACLSNELRHTALNYSSREQLAFAAFAETLEDIPTLLAKNNGLDPSLTISELRTRHEGGAKGCGVGRYGCTEDVPPDLMAVKVQVITRAYDVAELILRIDEFLTSREITKFHKQ